LNRRVYVFGNPNAEALPVVEGAEKCEPPPGAAKGAPKKRPAPGAALLCLDAETGSTIYSHPAARFGHIVSADGMIYAVESVQEGNQPLTPRVSLWQPRPAGLELAGRFLAPLSADELKSAAEIEWQANANPTIAEGRLFLRYGYLMCFDLRAEQPSYGWRHDGTGHARNARPPLKWFREENLAWTCELPGAAGSSPIVEKNKVFATCEPAGLACVDGASGKLLWQKDLSDVTGAGGRKPLAPVKGNANPTPIVREGRVYAAFDNGLVGCVNADGERLWATTIEVAGGARRVAAPILSEDVVVVQGKQLIGLSVRDGQELWSVPLPDGEPYGPPAKARLDGVNVLLTGWGAWVRAMDGKVLGTNLPRAVSASPVVDRGVVYCCGPAPGRQTNRLAALKLPATTSDDAGPQPLWQKDAPGAPYVGSPLVVGEILYVLDDRCVLHAIEAATGTPLYARKLIPDDERTDVAPAAGLLMAGDCVYAVNLGKLCRTVIFKPGREYAEVWQYAVFCGVGEPAFIEDRQVVRGGTRLYGLAGDTPSPPQELRAVKLAPLAAAELRQGAPVNKFADNTIPDNWVFAGPFPQRSLETDHLAALGGRGKTVAAAGLSVTHGGTTRRFQPLLPAHRFTDKRFTAGMPSIDITLALNRAYNTTSYFFTVIENDGPRFVRFEPLTPDGICWNYKSRLETAAFLGGKKLGKDEVLELEKGCYALMLQSTLGECETWGHIWMGPRLVDVSAHFSRKLARSAKRQASWPAYLASQKGLFVLRP
jgi:outer membrane protein assembly factor BamB